MTTFTIAETCKHLGISRATAMRWLRSGKLAAAMIGGAWRIPSSEIEKRLTYRIVRHAAEPLFTGPLSEAEVERITDDVAHVLRSVGAPVRKDGLRQVVLGVVPVDALLWRFIHRALISQSVSPGDPGGQDVRNLSEDWDQFRAGSGNHLWVDIPAQPRAITETPERNRPTGTRRAPSQGAAQEKSAAPRKRAKKRKRSSIEALRNADAPLPIAGNVSKPKR